MNHLNFTLCLLRKKGVGVLKVQVKPWKKTYLWADITVAAFGLAAATTAAAEPKASSS
jgi:hypothetical protein